MDTFRMFQALDAQTRDAAVDAATDKDEQIGSCRHLDKHLVLSSQLVSASDHKHIHFLLQSRAFHNKTGCWSKWTIYILNAL